MFEYDLEEDGLKFWLDCEDVMSMIEATKHLECIILDAWCLSMNKEELKINPNAQKRGVFQP